MEQYASNSHRSREEQSKTEKKKVDKVIKGKARTKKKSELSKVASMFISEDATSVKSYVLMDVLIPAVKKAISDIVTDGIDIILYGGSGGSSNRSRSRGSKVSYSKYYDDRDRDSDRVRARRPGRYDLDDIVLDTRGEAESVLGTMDDIIDTYGMVTVADLYDLVGLTCDHTAQKFGWTNLANAEPVRVRDSNGYGYALKLPKALPINK